MKRDKQCTYKVSVKKYFFRDFMERFQQFTLLSSATRNIIIIECLFHRFGCFLS